MTDEEFNALPPGTIITLSREGATFPYERGNTAWLDDTGKPLGDLGEGRLRALAVDPTDRYWMVEVTKPVDLEDAIASIQATIQDRATRDASCVTPDA